MSRRGTAMSTTASVWRSAKRNGAWSPRSASSNARSRHSTPISPAPSARSMPSYAESTTAASRSTCRSGEPALLASPTSGIIPSEANGTTRADTAFVRSSASPARRRAARAEGTRHDSRSMRERRLLTRAELVRLLDGVPAKWRPLSELFAATGVRRSSVLRAATEGSCSRPARGAGKLLAPLLAPLGVLGRQRAPGERFGRVERLRGEREITGCGIFLGEQQCELERGLALRVVRPARARDAIDERLGAQRLWARRREVRSQVAPGDLAGWPPERSPGRLSLQAPRRAGGRPRRARGAQLRAQV